MSEINRRGFLGSMGAVALGLLFRGKSGTLIEEPDLPEQAPSAVDVTVRPMLAFRPERIVIPVAIASLFVIENITIGGVSQFAREGSPIPADVFSADLVDKFVSFDAATPGMEIRFRVRYVGDDPRGARFQAALIGSVADGGLRRHVLPIDSGIAIVA